jgi:hypothetical protein
MKACDNCVTIFYFVLNVYSILSLYTFSDNFFNRFSICYLSVLFGNLFISVYLFLTIRRDPGMIKKHNHNVSEQITQNTLSTQNEEVNNSVEAIDIISQLDSLEEFEKICDACVIKIVLINIYKRAYER